jgi:hypothetical protein
MRPYFFRADNPKEQMTLTVEERQEYDFEFSVFSRSKPGDMQSVTLNKEQAIKLLYDLSERMGLVVNTKGGRK